MRREAYPSQGSEESHEVFNSNTKKVPQKSEGSLLDL